MQSILYVVKITSFIVFEKYAAIRQCQYTANIQSSISIPSLRSENTNLFIAVHMNISFSENLD